MPAFTDAARHPASQKRRFVADRNDDHADFQSFNRKKLVSIISNRDLLKRVVGKYQDLSKVKAEAVMTSNPEYVKGEDPIAYAVNKMAVGGYRHLPVLRADGTPLSIIMIKDVLSYLSRRNKANP